jgi:hypothetical protein
MASHLGQLWYKIERFEHELHSMAWPSIKLHAIRPVVLTQFGGTDAYTDEDTSSPSPLTKSPVTCFDNNTNYNNICHTPSEKIINMTSELSSPVVYPSHSLRILERNQYAHTNQCWTKLTNNPLNIYYMIMESQVRLK